MSEKLSNRLKRAGYYLVLISLVCTLFAYLIQAQSVTGMNVILGLITMTIGSGLAIAAAMANDSGRGGFFIHAFQFLGITYPLVYLVGMISSIAVLYSEIENRREIAMWLASMAGIHLLLIIALFAGAIIRDTLKR